MSRVKKDVTADAGVSVELSHSPEHEVIDNTDYVPDADEPAHSGMPSAVSPEKPLRRSGRTRKPPKYLGDYICHSQVAVLDHWRDRVAALIQLATIFPDQHVNICNAILYVITHAK